MKLLPPVTKGLFSHPTVSKQLAIKETGIELQKRYKNKNLKQTTPLKRRWYKVVGPTNLLGLFKTKNIIKYKNILQHDLGLSSINSATSLDDQYSIRLASPIWHNLVKFNFRLVTLSELKKIREVWKDRATSSCK